MSLQKITSYTQIRGGIPNVLDFGAKGDGTTDDTAAIQAAINSLPQYGTLNFAAGTYVISSTLTIGTNNITLQGNATIIAKANVQFEYMLSTASINNLTIKDLEFDVNQANRVSGQTVRFAGLSINGNFNTITNIVVSNTLGYNSVPAAAIGVIGNNNLIQGCQVINCGGTSGTNASDGIYTGGNQTIISNCIATNCTDTAFVLENSNYGLITGCTAYDCSCGAGISTYTATTNTGNVINGLTVKNWNATNTGGVSIGVVTPVAGTLYDTIVSNVVMSADVGSGYGTGSAIKIRNAGVGRVKQITVSNCIVDGASVHGIDCDGDVISVTGCRVKNVTSNCIQFVSGYENYASSNYVYGGAYGINIGGTASVITQNNVCLNQTSWGIYAFDTSYVSSIMNYVKNTAVGAISKASGATLEMVGIEGNNFAINNAVGSATSGSVVNKFVVTDRNGNSLGYVPIYTI